ncbi:hypothetical protein MRY87_04645 [bacterium]|nr:hypothetical protein [bacterium]
MEEAPPSEAVNQSHALLNSLRAAWSGEQSRGLTRELLELPESSTLDPQKDLPLEYIEQLFSSFSQEETMIICLDDPESLVITHFDDQVEELERRSHDVQRLLSRLSQQGADTREVMGELTSFYVGHFKAREAYIEGLIRYADAFRLWEMKSHWEDHLLRTVDLIEDSRDLLMEVARVDTLSSYLIQRVYDSCVLIPSSLKCQAHDMRHIRHLDREEFTFSMANIPQSEVDGWMQLGLDAEDAGYWGAYDITAEECAEWMHYGFLDPKSAGGWKARGFEPEMADIWAVQGYDPSEAYLCRHGGISTPEAADKLRTVVQ